MLTFFAVAPLFVRGIIAAAFICLAILLTAALIAFGIVLGRCLSYARCGYSLSILLAIVAIVATASIG